MVNRIAIEDLSKRNKRQKRIKWRLGICYYTLTITKISIHEIGADDIEKMTIFQGSSDQLW